MAARGQLYGLLSIIAEGANAATHLNHIRPIANAMGDAMSLALSSIALREQLRSQALRDPLTGLYNRRFLEEILERMCLDAERRKTSISAIMIDLDHFKKLNDQHGHAAGDAALRDVAAAIISCLRNVDIACRYGGEELTVLLSDNIQRTGYSPKRFGEALYIFIMRRAQLKKPRIFFIEGFFFATEFLRYGDRNNFYFIRIAVDIFQNFILG